MGEIDRRGLFGRAAAVMAASAAVMIQPRLARAQAPTPATPPQPSRMARLAKAVAENRVPVEYDGARFSGPGYDWLLEKGSAASAFLLGEEHGIAENPKLAGQVFKALIPSGYRHLAIEISPPMAQSLDKVLVNSGGAGAKAFVLAPESRVAFYGMKEEAEFLASVRAALPKEKQVLWGFDYEVGADRFLISRLARARKPAAADAALMKLANASDASWAKYESTRNPQFIFSFSGDPKLVQDLRGAWPGADAESRQVMDTLEQTFTINQLWIQQRGYDSNLARSRFIRSNLLHYWKAKRPDARVFMKFGASHLVRGVNMSDVFDLGTMVPELAAMAGGSSFHLLVLPGPGTQTANLDPTQFKYVPGNRDQYGAGMELFDQAVLPEKFTLFDMAPLRPIAFSGSKDVPLPLWRVIHGFDAVLIMTGSHPSANL